MLLKRVDLSGCLLAIYLSSHPTLGLSEERCTEQIANVMFCGEAAPTVGLNTGTSVRLDSIQIEGLAPRNVFLHMQAASEAGLSSDKTPGGFLL